MGTLGKVIGGCASEEDHRAQTSRCSATRIGLKREGTRYQGVKVLVRVICLSEGSSGPLLSQISEQQP